MPSLRAAWYGCSITHGWCFQMNCECIKVFSLFVIWSHIVTGEWKNLEQIFSCTRYWDKLNMKVPCFESMLNQHLVELPCKGVASMRLEQTGQYQINTAEWSMLPLGPQWCREEKQGCCLHGGGVWSRPQMHSDSETAMCLLQNGHGQNVPKCNRMREWLKKYNKQHTFKILSIHSQHFSKAAWISCKTVIRLRRVVPDHPAFMKFSNWQSLTGCWPW